MENAYQYIWKYRLCERSGRLTDGRSYDLLQPGILNTGSGPDFSNSRITIEHTCWAGDVEIHVKASDWHTHGHDGNKAYDRVILHVVGQSDCVVARSDGSTIPQLEIKVPAEFMGTYEQLVEGLRGVRCAESLKSAWPLAVSTWLERMGMERLQEKAQRVADCYRQNTDWAQTFFVMLSRALGFGTNSDAMELMALSLPLGFVRRHSDNVQQVQALLFGQAGLLDSSVHIFDEYYHNLCREYFFLAHKYNLRGMTPSSWKFSGNRPQNFPHRRLALLASLLCNKTELIELALDYPRKGEELREVLSQPLFGYWNSHYQFGDHGLAKGNGSLSASSVDLLLINAVAPVLYAYGEMRGDEHSTEAAISLLEDLKGENNAIIRNWKGVGLEAESAFRSQALLHLRRSYCDSLRCQECGIAYALLRRGFKNHEGRLLVSKKGREQIPNRSTLIYDSLHIVSSRSDENH